MSNDRELIHAARQWHAVHERRMAVGAEKRRIDKAIKAGETTRFWSHLPRQQAEAGRQVTELKRKELAALRILAKACASQRGGLAHAEVVDFDGAITLLPAAE